MSIEPGVIRKTESLDGVHWNILGQVYSPKQISEDCVHMHVTFPTETFVPPHIHPKQDEFFLMLDGSLDFVIGGETKQAHTGDLVCLPRGIAHGIFNNSGRSVTCLLWFTPTGKIVDLFRRIHNMARPDQVVALAPDYDVEFLPPVKSSAQL